MLFPALAFGYLRADAIRISFALAQAGEFGFCRVQDGPGFWRGGPANLCHGYWRDLAQYAGDSLLVRLGNQFGRSGWRAAGVAPDRATLALDPPPAC